MARRPKKPPPDPLAARYVGSAVRLRLNPEACDELRRQLEGLVDRMALQARLPNGDEVTLRIEAVEVYDEQGRRQPGPVDPAGRHRARLPSSPRP